MKTVWWSELADRPGKTRTWWHPLLVRLLDFSPDNAYAVRDEVLVGKLQLRVDILVIRREAGDQVASSYPCGSWSWVSAKVS